MELERKLIQISNAYYNRGLAKAKNRDLTGAARDLKQSLRYNRAQKDARNLLGLIYNETGEVGAALVQWVISINLNPEDNLADEYLQRVHQARGYLEFADQAAKKYNQALIYAANDNEDLATLLLKRMLEEFPQYVKAQELLALLYLHQEEYQKAGRCLYQASQVDRYNPNVQRYLSIAKHNTGRADVERKKLRNAFSHRQMQDDDVIMPPTYKENTGWQSVLNILAGLFIGAAAACFLALPASREALNSRHNEELRQTLETLNQKNIEIDGLQEDLTAAKAAQDQAEQELADLQSDNGGKLLQYQNLVRILEDLDRQDVRSAALLYVQTDWTQLQGEDAIADTLTRVYQEMASTGYRLLEQMGDEALNGGEGAAKAVEYYQGSLAIRPDNVSAIYKTGLAYQSVGDTDTANQYFGDVIMNHPDSEYAQSAKEQRGY